MKGVLRMAAPPRLHQGHPASSSIAPIWRGGRVTRRWFRLLHCRIRVGGAIPLQRALGLSNETNRAPGPLLLRQQMTDFARLVQNPDRRVEDVAEELFEEGKVDDEGKASDAQARLLFQVRAAGAGRTMLGQASGVLPRGSLISRGSGALTAPCRAQRAGLRLTEDQYAQWASKVWDRSDPRPTYVSMPWCPPCEPLTRCGRACRDVGNAATASAVASSSASSRPSSCGTPSTGRSCAWRQSAEKRGAARRGGVSWLGRTPP